MIDDNLVRKDVKSSTLKKITKSEVEIMLEPTKGDRVYSGIKGATSLIPIVGGAVSELFSVGVNSPMQQRRDKILVWYDNRLKQLEDSGLIKIDDLLSDQKFIDIISQSILLAVQNSQEEKIQLLKKFLLSYVLKPDVDHDRKIMFLRTIENLTLTHYTILKTMYEPKEIITKFVKDNAWLDYSDVNFEVMKSFGTYLDIDEEMLWISLDELATWQLVKDYKRNIGGSEGYTTEQAIERLVTVTHESLTKYAFEFFKFLDEY